MKATFVTSADVADDVVYTVVKAVFDNFDRFKGLHPAFANLKEEEMISDGLSAPLHPGAEKYYRSVAGSSNPPHRLTVTLGGSRPARGRPRHKTAKASQQTRIAPSGHSSGTDHMSDDKQFQAAAVENAAAGKGGLSQAELDELVASSDTGGRRPRVPVGTLILVRRAGLVAVPALDRLADSRSLSASASSTTPRRGRSTWPLRCSWPLPPIPPPAPRCRWGWRIGVPALLTFLFIYGAKDGTRSGGSRSSASRVIGAILLGSPKDHIPVWEWALAILGAAGRALSLFRL